MCNKCLNYDVITYKVHNSDMPVFIFVLDYFIITSQKPIRNVVSLKFASGLKLKLLESSHIQKLGNLKA